MRVRKTSCTSLSSYVIEKQLLNGSPLRYLDVGARDGDLGPLDGIASVLDIIGFDMDALECETLNASLGNAQRKYYPIVLNSTSGPRDFHITNFPASSGFYANREKFICRLAPVHMRNVSVARTVTVETHELDKFLTSNNLASPDFIKLDAEGAELDILKGGTHALDECLGVLAEARFQNMAGQPLFADMDAFLRTKGFSLSWIPAPGSLRTPDASGSKVLA